MYWRGYLSGARCKLFAYGSADATATPTSLAAVKSDWFSLSGASLPRLSWKEAINRCLSVLQMLDGCHDPPTFSGHIDYGKEASQLHSILVDLLDKVDNKVPFSALPAAPHHRPVSVAGH